MRLSDNLQAITEVRLAIHDGRLIGWATPGQSVVVSGGQSVVVSGLAPSPGPQVASLDDLWRLSPMATPSPDTR